MDRNRDSGSANDPRSLALGYGAPVDEAGVSPLPIALGLADLPAVLPGTVMVPHTHFTRTHTHTHALAHTRT